VCLANRSGNAPGWLLVGVEVHAARFRPAARLAQEQEGTSMIPKDCKRLAEVDFPIAEVSRHAAREKSIRHGDPGTLHLLRTDPQTENNRRKE
jgi:hypothetical protein